MAMTIMARKNTPDLEAILVGCTDDDLMLLAVSSGGFFHLKSNISISIYKLLVASPSPLQAAKGGTVSPSLSLTPKQLQTPYRRGAGAGNEVLVGEGGNQRA
jgi:hypothetical protein